MARIGSIANLEDGLSVRGKLNKGLARDGGLTSLVEDGTVVGNGTTNDSAAFQTLALAGGSYRLPASTYLLSTLANVTLSNALKLYGGPDAVITKGDAAATATLFLPKSDFIAENIRFKDGGGLLDCNGLDTTIGRIRIANCEFEDVEFALRAAELTPNANAKIGSLDFIGNRLKNVSRGVFISSAGASDVLLLGNRLDGSDRSGFNISPEQSTGQSTGRSDRQIFAFNFAKNVAFSGANSNPFKQAGRYQLSIGNINTNVVYNDVPGQANFEGFYTKTIGHIRLGDICIDGSGGQQGMFAMKGNGREYHASGEPYGYNNIMIGCLGMHTTGASGYTEDGIWCQAEDVICIGNLLDGVRGDGIHVQNESYKNLLFAYNHILNKVGSGIVCEGDHIYPRFVGNLIQRVSTGGGVQIRLDTRASGTLRGARVQDNVLYWEAAQSAVADGIEIDCEAAGDAIEGLFVTGNMIDGNNITGSNLRGVRLTGAGPINGMFLNNNMFLNMPDETLILCETGAGVGTVRVGENYGFNNRKKGTGTIAVGQSSVVITHGLPAAVGFTVTPDDHNIKITPTSKLAAATSLAPPWVSARTATTFTVSIDGNQAGADFTFGWEIYKWEWVRA